MSTDPDLLAAKAQAQLARTRLFATLGEVQERLKPANLAQNAVESATQGIAATAQKGAEAVRNRPIASAAVAGAVGLFLARGWIGKLLRRRNETAPVPDGLNRKTQAKSAKKGRST
ncbi:DUF3618 domain-containing protein [Sphingomonas gei]|uniref:DUF3618 domain-containing protein n=1 Tax=Sphingomonas gei TaxID=1395960 RepID=A0A4S1XJ84_9SPHN|nr:DUF3618 domain-containing protein [Sphingomonas gei]TGX56107.1 DUF3618 domain-containing protein [Sphingomonas gei]